MKKVSHLGFSRVTALFLCVVMLLNMSCFVSAETEAQTTETGVCAHEYVDSVCKLCGVTCEDHTASGWQYDGVYHWYICEECGVMYEYGDHFVDCRDGSCRLCPATVDADQAVEHVVNDWSNDWAGDTANHWRICSDCGEQFDNGTHRLSCAANECLDCGATGVEGNSDHDWDWDNWGFDSDHHWVDCKNCDATDCYDTHNNDCIGAADVCIACGQSGVTIDYVSHSVPNWDTSWQSDTSNHWHVCEKCGEKLDVGTHGLDCATGACRQCGATGVEGKTDHDWNWENWGSDQEICWLPCKNCDAVTNKSYHHTNCTGVEGVCSDCGRSDVTIHNISHFVYDWSDYWQNDTVNHWGLCDECGAQMDVGTHQVDCTTGACRECGATGVEGNTDHDWNWENWGYDTEMHWLPCKNCDAVTNKGGHFNNCTDAPGICSDCGQSDVTINGTSHFLDNWNDWQSDATNHWHVCVECKEIVDSSAHGLDCATGACRTCGATGVEGNTDHDWDWDNWGFDTEKHWLPCKNCTAVTNEGSHYTKCTEVEGVCSGCGQSDVPINGFSHVVNDWDNTWQHNETSHWHVCDRCGGQVDADIHWINCETGACRNCGATGVEGERVHSWNYDSWSYDAENHWRSCKGCDETRNVDSHWLDCQTGACRTCGATGVEGNTGHDWDWDNWAYDADWHWLPCKNCDARINEDLHRTACTDEAGVCTKCGQAGVNLNGEVSHMDFDWQGHWQHDTNYHWIVCTDCGETFNHDIHWLDCQTGECRSCGASGVDGILEHWPDWDTWYWDEYECWRQCTECGGESDRGAHFNMCYTEDKTECTNCGQTGVILDGVDCHGIGEPDKWYYDDTKHWLACSWCGIPCDESEHSAKCTGADSTCAVCGQSGVTISGEATHVVNWSDPWQYDTENHWRLCAQCGVEMHMTTHMLNCQTGECWCGAPDAKGEIGHTISNWNVWESDKESHWHICIDCGEKADFDSHLVDCQTGVCRLCGVADGVGTIGHTVTDWKNTWQYDGINHWHVCAECGENCFIGEHIIDEKTGACTECGATDIGETCEHEFEIVEILAPTCTETGVGKRVCTLCGKEDGQVELPTTEHPRVTFETAPTCTEEGRNDYYCGDCWEYLDTEIIPAMGHDMTMVDVVVEPTCTEGGYTTYTCTRGCDVTENRDEVAALGHKTETVTTAATCTAAGLAEEVCTRCKEVIDSEEIPALGHDMTKVVKVVAATCTKDGYTIYTCTRGCAVTENRDQVAALGHETKVVTTDPTCTVAGLKEEICTRCNEVIKSEEIAALGHETKVVTTAATCTAEGLKEEVCTRCEEVIKSEKIAALGHDLTKVVKVVAATCTKDGYTIYTCTRGCAVTEHRDQVAALGHETNTVITDATCTAEGLKEEICTRCEEVIKSEKIAALGHDITKVVKEVAPTCTKDGYTIYTCTRGCAVTEKRDVVAALGHNTVTNTTAATCTADGLTEEVCTRCDEIIKSEKIAALGHDMTKVVEVVKPTCTEAGYTTYTCARGCDVTEIRDEVAALGHNAVTVTTDATCTADGLVEEICNRCDEVLDSEVIAALGHDVTKVVEIVEPTCTEAGYTVYTCVRGCDVSENRDEVAALDHDGEIVTTNPTCTVDGLTEEICTRCDEVLTSEVIPALGHDMTKVAEVVAPTCTEVGYTVYTCTRGCEVTENRDEVAALGHIKTILTKDPTCTDVGYLNDYCEVCWEYLGSTVIPALGHDMTKAVEVVEATCTTGGYTTYTCARGCAVTETRDEVAALGHATETVTTEPTCTAAGLAEEICTRCKETIKSDVIAALGHEAETVTTEPTCTEDGLAEDVCTRCEEVIKSEVIPALGHDMTKVVEVVEATCTEGGYTTYTCSFDCDVTEIRDEVAELGHIVETVAKDPTCTKFGYKRYNCDVCEAYLGSTIIPAVGHELTTTETETAIVVTCANCDYKNETAKSEDASAPAEPVVPEAVAAPAVLPEQAVVKTVEEAVVETVQTEEAPVTIAIAVTEVVLENTPVVLPLPEEIQPAKVLNVSVILPEKIEEVEEFSIPEQMTITIPVEEEEITALKDMKLVLVLSDGTLIDIEYEIVEGKLIFTTTQIGVFAFIPVEE